MKLNLKFDSYCINIYYKRLKKKIMVVRFFCVKYFFGIGYKQMFLKLNKLFLEFGREYQEV